MLEIEKNQKRSIFVNYLLPKETPVEKNNFEVLS